MTHRPKLIAATLAVAVALVAGCSSSGPVADAPGTTVAAADAGSLTLVLAGTGATLTADRLAVDGAARVTWITDRPERDAGSVEVDALVTGWEGYGFDASPPNAVVTGASANGIPRSVPVVLSDPALDGGTLTFAVRYLGDGTSREVLELVGASVVVDGTGSGSSSAAVPAEAIAEITAALEHEIQRISAAQSNLESDWENIGLDIALHATLDGDFATAIGALQTAVADLSALADPTTTTVDPIVNVAETAVSTLQTQINTVLTEVDAAERAALAAALAAAL